MINAAIKKTLEIRLGICIRKTSLLHRPDDYIGFTPRCTRPTFYNKIAPMDEEDVRFSSLKTVEAFFCQEFVIC